MSVDIAAGQAGREIGMTQAQTSAESRHSGWTEEAAEAIGWAASQRQAGEEFTIEQLRADIARVGQLPEPPGLRAWGPVAVRATKLGYIERVGFGRSACARLAFVATYRAGSWPR